MQLLDIGDRVRITTNISIGYKTLNVMGDTGSVVTAWDNHSLYLVKADKCYHIVVNGDQVEKIRKED